MSYDVDAGGREFNYTSNMGEFFRDFGAYPGDWQGHTRHYVGDEIDTALAKIEVMNRSDLKLKYDPPNGWGSVEGATAFLREVRDACRWEVPEKVEVWL